MEAIDFRTQKEKEREIRDNSICANYLALAEKYPYVRPARIFERLSEKYKMSAIAIRLVIIKNGIITPKQRSKNA